MPKLEFEPEEEFPPVTTDAFGPMGIERLTIGDMSDLDEQGARDADPIRLASLMIAQLCHKADGTHLTADEVADLSPADRQILVDGLIAANPDLFGEAETENIEDKDVGTRVRKTGVRITVERELDESAEHYLQRGWQEQVRRLNAIVESMLPAVRGMRDTLKSAVMPDLIKNVSAASRLGQQLKSISALGAGINAGLIKPPAFGGLKDGPASKGFAPPRPAIDFSKSPAAKTNVLLAEVKVELAQMRAMATLTAEMQQSLNDVARTILTEFSKGAEDAAKTSSHSLEMAQLGIAFAKRSYWVAIASLIVSTAVALAALFISMDASKKQDADQKLDAARLQAARQEEIRSRDALTSALDRHSRAVEAEAERTKGPNQRPVRPNPDAR